MEELVKFFGLTPEKLAAFSAFIVLVINGLFKQGFGLKKKQLLYATIGLSFGLSAISLYPNWLHIFGSTFLVTVVAAGSWETFKLLAHKIGVK